MSYSKKKMIEDIDRLGELRAEVADLEEEMQSIKDRLLKTEITEADGEYWKIKISHFEQNRVDYKGLVQKLEPSTSMVKKFTTTSDRIRFSVLAR